MASKQRRLPVFNFADIQHNAVIQLIVYCGVGYVMLAFAWGIIRIVFPDDSPFFLYFIPQIGIAPAALFQYKIWTLFTYGWFLYPGQFWHLVTNMLWLYMFGSIVQTLIGNRQILPLFLYSLVIGGLFYLLGSYIDPSNRTFLMGQDAGIVGLAVGAVTLSPRYRIYFTEYFSVPLALIAGIYLLLMLFSFGLAVPLLLLTIGGAIVGFAYIKLLQSGFQPGIWIYQVKDKLESLVTPKEEPKWRTTRSNRKDIVRESTFQKRTTISKTVDDILDKINQKGYNSLTQEEKDILKRAGQEK